MHKQPICDGLPERHRNRHIAQRTRDHDRVIVRRKVADRCFGLTSDKSLISRAERMVQRLTERKNLRRALAAVSRWLAVRSPA